MPGRLSPIQAVEAVHLCFLRALEAKLDRSHYVVKGGVNLRAWFGSFRYSEDLELDALRGEAFELRDKVGSVLKAPAFRDLLRIQGLTLTRATRPKQTETTQRWKLELALAGQGMPLHTKIEFSRRGSDEPYLLEPALAEVIRPYGIPVPTANHYTAAAAIRQKIAALAGRREVQARDVWDLEHLFRTTRVDVRPLPAALARVVDTAFERAMGLRYEAFASQVLPYLAPEHQELFESKTSWQRIQDLVGDRLLELRA